MVELPNHYDIVSPVRRPETSKKSFVTSTPIKRKPSSSGDEIIILDVIPASNRSCNLFSRSPKYAEVKKEPVSFAVGSPNTDKLEEYWKLRKEIKYSYKRMTYRVDKMLDEGFKKDSPREEKARPRSSSRSRRSRDVVEPTTPVRRSSRLQKSKENEKPYLDENNNEAKSAYLDRTASSSNDTTLRMKKWIHEHPYIDMLAPLVVFLLFAIMMFVFVSQLIGQKIPQQLAATAYNYGQQAYYRMQSYLNGARPVRAILTHPDGHSSPMLFFALLVTSTMAQYVQQFGMQNQVPYPVIQGYGLAQGNFAQGKPPSYVPAFVSSMNPECDFDVCFHDKCCKLLGIPTALVIIVTTLIIIAFSVFLVCKIVQLLGQMRQK